MCVSSSSGSSNSAIWPSITGGSLDMKFPLKHHAPLYDIYLVARVFCYVLPGCVIGISRVTLVGFEVSFAACRVECVVGLYGHVAPFICGRLGGLAKNARSIAAGSRHPRRKGVKRSL